MSKYLRLYNTFLRSINNVEISGNLVRADQKSGSLPITGSLYICGPTVYTNSHMGHALTYIRADLFRRIMRGIFNVRLITVMNITDIDDKILARAQEETDGERIINRAMSKSDGGDSAAANNSTTDPKLHPFNTLSDKYYRSFLKDMDFVRVLPPDLTIKVSRQIQLIINFIRQLEKKGHAYLADNGDIYFRVASLSNYEGRSDSRKSIDVETKQDPRDFVLWKAAKPNEPVWHYWSEVREKSVPGRPGWHVQCSAISSSVFGKELDFHYGGKDLIFPHHYNEEACCCAFHSLDTSKTIHAWSKHWLHSGHLILRKEKMSKSLGNVIAIHDFVKDSSVNALRILCLMSHYRTNIEFSEDLLSQVKLVDHKLGAFTSYLRDVIVQRQDNWSEQLADDHDEIDNNGDIQLAIQKAECDIIDGACDDLDLERGLLSLLELSKLIQGRHVNAIKTANLISASQLLEEWCHITGLEYGSMDRSYNSKLINIVKDYRENIRTLVISELKNKQTNETSHKTVLNSILTECDNVRSQIDDLGIVIRDNKT